MKKLITFLFLFVSVISIGQGTLVFGTSSVEAARVKLKGNPNNYTLTKVDTTFKIVGLTNTYDIKFGDGESIATRSLTLNPGTGVNITGGTQTLEANRTWTISIPQSVSTSASPTFAGITLSGLSNGVLKSTSGVVSSSTIVNADISSSAAIDYTKITGLTVNNVAALKLKTGVYNGQLASLLGYYNYADGGEGNFYWNSTSTATDNGGTIIQVTGVSTGRWIRLYNDFVNVKWFGASPSFDSTIPIQNALNLNTTTIFDDAYITSSTLNVSESYLIFTPKGQITSSATGAALYYTATSTKKRCGGEGIRIYGNSMSETTTGIIVDGRKNLYFEDIGVFNVGGNGFELRDQTSFIENIVINKMEIDNTGGHGLFFNKYNNSSFINEITITALEIRRAAINIATANEINFKNSNTSGGGSKISAVSFFHCNIDMRTNTTTSIRNTERLANGIDMIKFESSGAIIEHINFYDCTFENTGLNNSSTQFVFNFLSGAGKIKVIAPIFSPIGFYRNQANVIGLYFESPDKQIYSTKGVYNKYVGTGSFLNMFESTDANPSNTNIYTVDIRKTSEFARIGLASTTKDAMIAFDTDNADYSGNYAFIQKAATNGDLTIAQNQAGNIVLKTFGSNKVTVNQTGVTSMITNFPTTNPNIAGALWNDGGVLKISTGL